MKYRVDRAQGALRRTDELVAKAVADLILPPWHRTLHYHGGGDMQNRDICVPLSRQRIIGAAANIWRYMRAQSPLRQVLLLPTVAAGDQARRVDASCQVTCSPERRTMTGSA